MKIQPKTALISVLAPFLLTGCGQDKADDAAPAKSRFSLVSVD